VDIFGEIKEKGGNEKEINRLAWKDDPFSMPGGVRGSVLHGAVSEHTSKYLCSSSGCCNGGAYGNSGAADMEWKK
jgi:hypothetical protein